MSDVSQYMGTILIWPISFAPEDFSSCNGATLQRSQYQVLHVLLGNTFGGNHSVFNLPDLINRVPLGAINLGREMGGMPNAIVGNTGGSYNTKPAVSVAGALSSANLPGHTHPASFTPTTDTVPVVVSAPTAPMQVTIPVGPTAQPGPPANPLTENVYLSNSVMTGVNAGSFRGPYQSSAPTGSLVNVLGGTAKGTPGGTFTGYVKTVTGGTVDVLPNTGSAPMPLLSTGNLTSGIPMPPWAAMNFIICVNGLFPTPPQ
jgi:microcystin-dependent protein